MYDELTGYSPFGFSNVKISDVRPKRYLGLVNIDQNAQ